MNETSKGEARSILTVIKKAAANFILVAAGAAAVGAVYAGLCGAVLGLAHGAWWSAAVAGGLRGGSAGLAAGVLTATFGIWMSGRVALLPIFSPKERRYVDVSHRRDSAAGRPFVPTRTLSGMGH